MDERSTWHSGATTANGAAEGFSMDQALPGLDYGNSTFDMRHTFTNSFVWQLPWLQSQQVLVGHFLGGWSLNNIINWHSGFPWTPYCSDSSFPSSLCDYNEDGVSDHSCRICPRSAITPPTLAALLKAAPDMTADMFTACGVSPTPSSSLGCTNWTGAYDGNLGRNTFRAPSFADIDLSLFKNFKVSERVNLQFRGRRC